MSNFFSTAERLYHKGQLGTFSKHFECIELIRNYLRNRQIKMQFDLDNMEQVFSCIDMGIALGGLGEIDSDQLRNARDSFVRLTCCVLDSTQQVVVSRDPNTQRETLQGPSGYNEMLSLCKEAAKQQPSYKTSVITFNYDVGVETAIITNGLEPISPSDRPDAFSEWKQSTVLGSSASVLPVCKLHGSLHWRRQGNRGIEIDHDGLQKSIAEAQKGLFEGQPVNPSTIARSPFQNTAVQHGEPRTLGYARGLSDDDSPLPLLIPPTDDKAQYRSQLEAEWRAASELLRSADVVCIAGYSMPPTDEFFRQFFTISMAGEHRLRKLFIINPNQDALKRLTNLVGAPSRDIVSEWRSHFGLGVSQVRDTLANAEWVPTGS